jgi:hypothetical protein
LLHDIPTVAELLARVEKEALEAQKRVNAAIAQ